MNPVLADTSALFAFLVEEDVHHERALHGLRGLRERGVSLLTSSYVLLETYALLGRRVGLKGVAGFRRRLEPLLSVTWVDATLHERGLDLHLRRGRRQLSLVDAVSFELMRAERIREAFAFGVDFEREGFSLVA